MASKLLFSMVQEFNKPRSMAGKIWRIKLLSGTLSVNDKISLYCVNAVNQKNYFNRVDAAVKHIKYGDNADNLDYHAVQGDFVTININQCYLDGKKIDKSKIAINKTSMGTAQGEIFRARNQVRIQFEKNMEFIDRVKKSLEKVLADPKKRKAGHSAPHTSLFMWFGNTVAVSVADVDKESGIVAFDLVNGRELPIPESSELRYLMTRSIIKYRSYDGKFADKKNRYKWRYAVGEFIF